MEISHGANLIEIAATQKIGFNGSPRHLKIEDQITIYTEIGICWMHSGRLQLAQKSIFRARERLQEMGADAKMFSPLPRVEEGSFNLWRAWTDTLNIQALIAMRLGRERPMIEDILKGAVEIARRIAIEELASLPNGSPELKANGLAARRVICRYAQLCLNAGKLDQAIEDYELATSVEKAITGKNLSGDALRRYIEAIVRRGPCLPEDLATAEMLIDEQIGHKQIAGTRRRLSNDIISLFVTKAMLLRARGEFIAAKTLLEETEKHEFVLRGECTFTARAELALETFRVRIASGNFDREQRSALQALLSELQARHHMSMYWHAMVVFAEMEIEPRKSEILLQAERSLSSSLWYRRTNDFRIIREGGSPIMAMVC
ncbi:hypothetical protein [Rhizobium ruizarguesonis]|uniref:hypothetical protein n=1 Tax=Rhizobium ruizarguesonis TaxID=2081791 RepID=UPI0010307448|nr:hypothetical protein [Rhizobium ruizarguesonis]TBA52716.1 hypothetical protein ELH57_34365 [Rhizobium ruizarguesonis]